MDILVTGRHTELADAFRRHVSDKLARLARLDPKALRVQVEVCREHNPRLAEQRDRVELTWHGRGPVVRAEAAASDPFAALDLATAKLEERLRRAADRRHSRHAQATRQGLSRHRPAPPGRSAELVSADLAADSAAADTAADLPGWDARSGAAEHPQGNGRPTGEAALPTTAVADQRGSTPAVPAVAAAATVVADGVEQDVVVGEIDVQSGLVVREKVHAAVPMTVDEALHRMELIGHDFYLFADAKTGVASVVYRRRGYAYGVLRLAALHPPLDQGSESADSPSPVGPLPAGAGPAAGRG